MKLADIATKRVYSEHEGGPDAAADPRQYDRSRAKFAKELEELGPRECHWPLNNGNPFLFCAAPVLGDKYCAVHLRLGVRKGEQRTV